MQIKHPHGALGQIAHGCCSNGALQRAGGRYPPSTTARLLQELKGHVHLIAQLEPGPKQIHPGPRGQTCCQAEEQEQNAHGRPGQGARLSPGLQRHDTRTTCRYATATIGRMAVQMERMKKMDAHVVQRMP